MSNIAGVKSNDIESATLQLWYGMPESHVLSDLNIKGYSDTVACNIARLAQWKVKNMKKETRGTAI